MYQHPAASPPFYFLDQTPPDADIRALHSAGQHPPFNVAAIRRDFPILSERVNGRPLIWLDNAATTQKPQAVIDRLAYFYAHENSNIHRAAHELAARATDAYEGARATVQRFLGASSPQEIVFVRGATEAINLVAQSWGRQNIGAGDEIIVSHLEHHANIVPWQQLVSEKGAKLRVIPVDDSGQILLDEYQKLLSSRTKLVSVTQVSNALGTIVPVREVADLAHRAGARVLIDGAQAVSHMPVDVQALGADFYVFSGHKVFGPTGIGILYGTAEILESMPPWQGGGNMIASVTFERTTYQKPPSRFEAGTGNIADAAGLAAALDYITRLGMANIDRYEHDLLSYATAALQTVPGLRLIGTANEKASVLSFVLAGHDPVAVGKALNEGGYRGSRRPPLCRTHPAPLRRHRHGPSISGVLQHLRGSRHTGRSLASVGGSVRAALAAGPAPMAAAPSNCADSVCTILPARAVVAEDKGSYRHRPLAWFGSCISRNSRRAFFRAAFVPIKTKAVSMQASRP